MFYLTRKNKKKPTAFAEVRKTHAPLHKNQNGRIRLGLWVGKSVKSQNLRVREATEDSNHKTVRTSILPFLKN